MKALLVREIKSFFGSPIGYLVIAIFLLLNGLFLWVFEGQFNILKSGFADLSPFFTLAPWILIFLIPAVTMRSFSDEKKQGTIELMLTKPLSTWEIVNGKFFGAFLEGQMISKEAFLEMAKLPSRDQLIVRLLGMMKYPLTALGITLSEIGKNKNIVTIL